MNIDKQILGIVETNSYIIKNGDVCFVVDPADDYKRIMSRIGTSNLQFILLTHGHFDHVLALGSLKNKYPDADIYIGANDENMLRNFAEQSSYIGQKLDNLTIPLVKVKQDSVIHFGNQNIRVIETPGHTEGSVCYLLNNILFSGDTLFYHTIGRTDFPGGDPIAMLDSLNKLADLPDKTIVYPGHGPDTTVGREKKYNPFFSRESG